mmetsp:Transcript_19282/g.22279  ORF Transcript_19282/g.22279 Transcript_19282/m.22279 type:complete len:861 (+) Transcript_19282:169-2751(+)
MLDQLKGENNVKIRSTKNKRFLMLIFVQSFVLVAHNVLSFLSYATFSLWVLTYIANYHWSVTLRPLLTQYRWDDKGQKKFSKTYYDRNCDRRDFSTSNFTDLIVRPEWDTTMAAENILTHGVSVFPKVLDEETSQAFRNFTLERNKHLNSEEMVYVMNAKTKNKQTRWSFAFSSKDHPIVKKALLQIVNHEKLVGVLELFLGKNPAVIKMQTITQRYKAEHQGWHPDVNAEASVKSHARNFMMHFSLFITLQDTTNSMGSSGVCPGTQYCTRMEDFEFGCKQIVSGKRDDNKLLWLAGDAVLMNQNTYHRGWKHTDKKRGDRAIIVITFTSRPRFSDGKTKQHPLSAPLPSEMNGKRIQHFNENITISSLDAKNFPIQSWEDERKKNMYPESRVLSLGTPLTCFGYTLYDMKDSFVTVSPLLAFLRYFGIYKAPNTRWGWNYMNSVFSRISAESHKFKMEDLSGWLNSQRNFIKQNRKATSYFLRLRSHITEWILKKVILGTIPNQKKREYGIYDMFILLSLIKASNYFRTLFIRILIVFVFFSFTTTWISLRIRDDKKHPRGKIQECFLKGFLKLIKNIFMISMCLWFVSTRFQSSTFIRTIPEKTRPAFPNMISTVSYVPSQPTRDCVLVGTRFDSLYLGIFNRFFDYHTGNLRWRKLVREVAETPGKSYFYSSMPHIANAIIDSILVKIGEGNLLLQDAKSGNFFLHPNPRIFARRAILLEKSLLLLELDRSISFMIAHLRFDAPLRSTSLALFSVKQLENIRVLIFGEDATLFKPTSFVSSTRRSSTQFRLLTLLKPLNKFVATLQPEKISSYKQFGKQGVMKLNFHSSTKVISSNRKRTARADVILELNKNKRQQ